MEQWEKNKRMCMRGWRLMMLSVILIFACFISVWFTIPAGIAGTIGPIMVFIGISRESKRQVKELLEELHNLTNNGK